MVVLSICRDNTGLAAFSYKAQVSIFIMSPDPTFDILAWFVWSKNANWKIVPDLFKKVIFQNSFLNFFFFFF